MAVTWRRRVISTLRSPLAGGSRFPAAWLRTLPAFVVTNSTQLQKFLSPQSYEAASELYAFSGIVLIMDNAKAVPVGGHPYC